MTNEQQTAAAVLLMRTREVKSMQKTIALERFSFSFYEFLGAAALFVLFFEKLMIRFSLPLLNLVPSRSDFSQGSFIFLMITLGILSFGVEEDKFTFTRLSANIFFAYGIFFGIEFSFLFPAGAAIAFALYLAIVAGYAIYLRKYRRKRKKSRQSALGLLLRWAGFSAKLIVTGFALICFVVVAWGDPEIEATVSEELYLAEESPGVSGEYVEAMSVLYAENWECAAFEDKLTAMQLVADEEAAYLGLPFAPSVIAEPKPLSTTGSYSSGAQSISISIDHLLNDSSFACTDTVLHECFHAYEDCLCKVYESADETYRSLHCLRPAAVYIAENRSYIDGDDDFEGYYQQALERDARIYAADRLQTQYGRYFSAE